MRRKSVLLVAAFLLAALSTAYAAAGSAEVKEFPLEEISAFGKPDLIRGQLAWCKKEKDESVAAYPDTLSENALYGSIRIGGAWDDPTTGTTYHFCIDESKGAGKGHNVLYFDLNGNLDLTDEKPIEPMKERPAGAVPPGWEDVDELVFFDYIDVPVDFGEGIGVKGFRLLPRFHLTTKYGFAAALGLVCPVARTGEIAIGSNRYTATLGQAYWIGGRFDKGAYIDLAFKEGQNDREGGMHQYNLLHTMRYFDGTWYALSTTPTGDRLFVRPYDGDFGALEIRLPGSENAAGVSGSFSSPEVTVLVGKIKEEWISSEATAEALLPVGDYRPDYITVEGNGFRISISFNYHSDGRPRERDRDPVYGLRIRKEAPFVYDFSNEPEVMFASPKTLEHFKPGDTVEVKAVLTDPVQDIMIRNLDDTTRKEAKTYKDAGGIEDSYKTFVSLDPAVTVKDSSGKVVAEGKLPFG